MIIYTCPHCAYQMPEDEADGCIDCGCPSCRRYIDWSDYPDQIEDDEQATYYLLLDGKVIAEAKGHTIEIEDDADTHENIHEAL